MVRVRPTNLLAARNILLFSLLVDHPADDGKKEAIWNIYYELYLDDASLDLLEEQSNKLYELSQSMEVWHASSYGRLLRICDPNTLNLLRKVWSSYTPDGTGNKQKAEHRQHIDNRLKKARNFKEKLIGKGVVATRLRSSAPMVLKAMEDIGKSSRSLWDKDDVGSRPNPSLVLSFDNSSTLHYGTDSMLGFHLSAAYAPLVSASPHTPSAKVHNGPRRLTETAQLQFSVVQRF